MQNLKLKNIKKESRKRRSRSRIFGSSDCPRLSIFRSNRYIYTQLINDQDGKTVLALSTRQLKDSKKNKKTKTQLAELMGKSLAEKALGLGIKKAVFHRGPYKYHGQVRAVAEGARSKGLKL